MTPNSGPLVPAAQAFVGFTVVQKSGVSSSVTNTSAETVLATIPLPPLGPNGQLRVECYWSMTNSANTKTFRKRLGSLAGTIISTFAATTIASCWSWTILFNQNAVNAQTSMLEVARGTDGIITTSSAGATAVDMSQSQSLVITGQLATSTETITLLGYTIEVIP